VLNRKRAAFITVAIVVFGAGYRIGQHTRIPLPSYQNTKVCLSLPPNLNIKFLISKLGYPIGGEKGYVLFAPSATKKPIRAQVDERNGDILLLICDPP
jgi:hypothetical protein